MEAIRQIVEHEVAIEPGTTLYHGTSEKFELSTIRPGGYDEILWTTTDPTIAKTYIPVGNNTYVHSSSLAKPPRPDDTFKIAQQHSLGIEYDTSEIEMRFNQVSSYREAPFFENHPMMKLNHEAHQKFYDFQKTLDEFREKYLNEISYSHYKIKPEYANDKEIFRKWNEMETTAEKLSHDYFQKYDREKIMNQIVNSELRKLGYEPMDDYPDAKEDLSWNLFTKDGKILPNNSRVDGRLLTIKPRRELQLYDFTLARSIEGDLTDLDYHKIGLFRQAEKKGYDGVVINDFAQSHNMGNVGHVSYGLFKHVIPDLTITESPARHEDLKF